MFHSLMESCNVNHMPLLVVKAWHQFLNLADLHLFLQEKSLAVHIMQLLWVIHIYFEYITMIVFLD